MPFPCRASAGTESYLQEHGFVALCGPTGAGKHRLMQQVFTNMSVLRLETQVNDKNVEMTVKALQSTLTSRSVTWVVSPAELIKESAMAKLQSC